MAQTLVTSNNLSPLVLILTWLLCIISVLSIMARGAAKLIFTRSIKSDDYSSLLSLVISPSCSQLLLILLTRKRTLKCLSIAQSIAVTFRTSNGLGKHVSTLDAIHISKYSKVSPSFSVYTNKILADLGSRLLTPPIYFTYVAYVFPSSQ